MSTVLEIEVVTTGTDKAEAGLGKIEKAAEKAEVKLTGLQRMLNSIAATEMTVKINMGQMSDLTRGLESIGNAVKTLNNSIITPKVDTSSFTGLEKAIKDLSSKIGTLGVESAKVMTESAKQTTTILKNEGDIQLETLKQQGVTNRLELQSQLKQQEIGAAASAKIRIASAIAEEKEIAKARKDVVSVTPIDTTTLTKQLQAETEIVKQYVTARVAIQDDMHKQINASQSSNYNTSFGNKFKLEFDQVSADIRFSKQKVDNSRMETELATHIATVSKIVKNESESSVSKRSIFNNYDDSKVINERVVVEKEFYSKLASLANENVLQQKNADSQILLSHLELDKKVSDSFDARSKERQTTLLREVEYEKNLRSTMYSGLFTPVMDRQDSINIEAKKRNAAEEIALFDKVRNYKNSSLDTDSANYRKRADELAATFSSIKFAPKIDTKTQDQFDSIIDRINKLKEQKESVLFSLKEIDVAYENHKNKTVQANLEIKAAEEARAKATQNAVNYSSFWKNELDALDARM